MPEYPALVLDEPLSFWGGIDATTGEIVDPHHPQHGARIAGRVLVMPSGRGSSSSSSVMAECLASGTGPVAILLGEPDAILVVGAFVAAELGGPRCPIAVIGEAWRTIRTGDRIAIDEDGRLDLGPR